MLKNYQNSLKRKRINYTKPRKYKEDYTTREELDKLIWDMPMTEIAKDLNVSTDYVKKWCDEWDISRPDPSYWPSGTAGRKKKN
jgi:hypothetical protein